MATGTKSPLKLGVTGGIGSGKTSVCRVFNVLGIPIFSADKVAKDILDTDQDIKLRITAVTGKDLYAEGKLDRAGLANLIFNNPSLLGEVNSLIHPLVFSTFKEWVEQQSSLYVIMEAAILFESRASELVDRIVTVTAPLSERIKRVMHRNNITYGQVFERIRNQVDDDEKIKLSHYVISNSDNDMIIPAIIKIHNDLLNHINTGSNG